MKKLNNYLPKLICLLFVSAIFINSGLYAQEHPEHPEHPSDKSKTNDQLTMKQLAEAVSGYIAKTTKEGIFEVKDEKEGKTLKLKLENVHDERMSAMGNDVYFVCADFRGDNDTLYDIDFFMKGTTKDNLEATEVHVHKVNGKKRYHWHEANGVWTRHEGE